MTVVVGLLVAADWWLAEQTWRLHHALTSVHYTIYFGPDLTLGSPAIFWLPGAVTAIALANLLVAGRQPDGLWRRTWSLITLLVTLLLTAAGVVLWYINRLR